MCLTSVNIIQCTSLTISYIFSFVIISSFLLKNKLREAALLFCCFNFKKSAAESHRMLVEAYGDNALSETTCRDWFRRFNDDNFDLSENRLRKVEDCQLQALLDEDNTQSQKMLAEHWVFLKHPFPCDYMS